jgi:hypothetical protein
MRRAASKCISAALAAALAGSAQSGMPAPHSDTIDETAVRAHMGFLASDAMNGRGSGTRDEWIAATYIAAQLRRLGLEPLGDNGDYVETVEMLRNEVVGAPVLNIGTGTWTHGDQMMVVKLSAAGTRGPLQKFNANIPVQAGATLLMPESADPGTANTQGAALVLWLETPAVRARWSELTRRALARRLGLQARLGGGRKTSLAVRPVSAARSARRADAFPWR